jgi:membrane associated rhomboid family serine protease
MLIPYNVDVAMQRLPIANWVLIGVTCVISFLIEATIPWDPKPIHIEGQPKTAEEREKLEKALQRNAHPFAVQPRDPAVWQIYTSLFAHAGLVHLLGNMFFLFVFGNAVNAKVGHGLFVLGYFLCGTVEGAVWLLIGPGPAIGSSGAIMGIVGMFLVLYPRNEVSVYYWYFTRMGVFHIASVWLILFYMGWDLIGALFFAYGGIGFLAHVTGGMTGIVLAVILCSLQWITPSDDDEENLLQVVGLQPKREKSTDKIIGQWQKRKR